MTEAPSHPQRPSLGRASLSGLRPPQGWRGYMVLCALLVPICNPRGPGQSALLDLATVPALGLFGLMLLAGRRLQTPLFVSVLLIAIGSILATFGASSMSKAALTLTQDVYLFSWFLLIVNVMRGEGDVRAMRVAWMWSAVFVSAWTLYQVVDLLGSLSGLLGARGWRPPGTMYNSNMLADYLVISLFMIASLWKDVPRRVVVPAGGIVLLALIATKSNGGMVSLLAGAVVWLVVRAIASRLPMRPVLASLALVAGLAAFGWWMNAEWRVGDSMLESVRRHTFAARMEHSTEERGRIRETLERTYARSPLGIGPGNSDEITVSIAERERKDSYQSKEAHSDYVAYAIERGPLGFAGLLVMTVLTFSQVATYWKHRPRRGVHFDRASLWTACMSAALVASAVHSLVIEKLHFRHFWLLLAMVCGSAHIARRRAARRRVLVPEPAAVSVTPVGLPPHVPGRLAPALATTSGLALTEGSRTGNTRLLPSPTTPALARRYGSTGTHDPSGGVVS